MIVRLGEWWHGYTSERLHVIWNTVTGEVVAVAPLRRLLLAVTPAGEPADIDRHLPNWRLRQKRDGNTKWIATKLTRNVKGLEDVGRYFLRRTGGRLPAQAPDELRAEQLWALGRGLIEHRRCGYVMTDGRVVVYSKMMEAEVARAVESASVDQS